MNFTLPSLNTRVAMLPLLLTFFLTGCYTNILAPGAVGKVVDAETGAPVRGAQITRPMVEQGFVGGVFVLERLPAASVLSDKSGGFNFAPATYTRLAFLHLHNPGAIGGSFVVSADGYTTNELDGVATAHNLWRVELGTVLLKRP